MNGHYEEALIVHFVGDAEPPAFFHREPVDGWSPLHQMLAGLDGSVRETAKHLATAATRGAERLTVLAAKLAQAGAYASFNSLGEMQPQGLEIDRLCALLDERKRMRSRVLHLLTRAGRDAK